MNIPIPIPSKSNSYEVHFSKVFWEAIYRTVEQLKKYVKGPLYWIGPSSEVKQAQTLIAFYVKRILEDDTDGPVRVTIWMKGHMDLDNGLKACLDAIQLSGRVKNDKQCAELHVYRLPGKNDSFDLEIEKMEE